MTNPDRPRSKADMQRLTDALRDLPAPSDAVRGRLMRRIEASILNLDLTVSDGAPSAETHASPEPLQAASNPASLASIGTSASTTVATGISAGTQVAKWAATGHVVAIAATTFALGMGAGAGIHARFSSSGIVDRAAEIRTVAEASDAGDADDAHDTDDAHNAGDAHDTGDAHDADRKRDGSKTGRIQDPAASRVQQTAPRTTARRDQSSKMERSLIERASNALARGWPNEAMQSLNEHRRRFRKGRLAQEREFLTVETLIALKRTAEAREAGARFLATYPTSLFRAALEEALRGLDE